MVEGKAVVEERRVEKATKEITSANSLPSPFHIIDGLSWISHSLNCLYYRCAQILTILFFLVLKMDVERFEFDVLSSMLARSMWPEQIMMEVHWATRMVDVSTMLRIIQAAELSLFFGMLFTHGG